MALLKLNVQRTELCLNYIKGKAGEIGETTSLIGKMSECQGIIFHNYIDFTNEVSKMMKKYAQLVEKDIADIRSSKLTVIELDKKIVDIINNSCGGNGF